MANHFILLFTLFLTHLADANYWDGQYTTNAEDILQGIQDDIAKESFSTWLLESVLPMVGGTFQSICKCDLDQKLSVCIKVLQHKLKELRPTSFTVDPTESNCECRLIKFTGSNNKPYTQKMYTCPKTTVKYTRADDYESSDEEPPFLLGPAYHKTEIKVRFTDGRSQGNKTLILGQLTGFDKRALNFDKTLNGHYTYKPNYLDFGASGSRETESGNYYRSDLEEPLLRNYSK